MGGKLGTLFSRAGHEVIFSYSRRYEKLEELAHQAGGNSRAGSPLEAAREADVILLAVHWSRLDDVLSQVGEVIAEMISGARVVAAFQAVPSEVFFDVFEARHNPTRPSLVYCGDDASAKVIAEQLISEVGFDPLDAGPLGIARYIEPFAMLIAQLAYEGPRGPELSYRFEWLGRKA
jgi:predicted dinucleotide-binding enzyme